MGIKSGLWPLFYLLIRAIFIKSDPIPLTPLFQYSCIPSFHFVCPRQSQLSIEDVTATLAMMELKGMVRQVGGMRYTSVREDREIYGVDEVDQDDH